MYIIPVFPFFYIIVKMCAKAVSSSNHMIAASQTSALTHIVYVPSDEPDARNETRSNSIRCHK